jgi:glycosyltransferase involved in cell wall biosynthesis
MTTQQRQLPVSLLVMTWNEAHNIGRCLDSVPFVTEKLVIDSGSTDDTVRVAQAHGARVVHQDWLGFGPQRNFASTQATNDWILFLDADESLPPELVAEFEARLPALLASRHSGAELRRSAWYMGAPMRWYRPMVGERVGRFYHRGRARWTDASVHEALCFDGTAELLKVPFHHHHSPTLVHKQLKVLAYSELKAIDWAERGRRPNLWLCPLVYLAAFIKDYFLRLAMLDGSRGFAVAHVAASYAVYKRLRLYELTVNPESRESARRIMLKAGLIR